MGNSPYCEAFDEPDELIQVIEREGIIKDIADGFWTVLEVSLAASIATYKILKSSDDQEESNVRNHKKEESTEE